MSMISPDVTAYADLTLYDQQPSDILAAALADAAWKLPGWIPQEGNQEMILLEELALEAAQAGYSINRLPSAVFQIVLAAAGITQQPGTPPTATVTFSVSDTYGHTIPAGAHLRIPATVTGTVDVLFTTTQDATAPQGSLTTNAVTIQGTANTDAANNATAGTPLDVLDTLYVVNGCQLATAVSGGALPETGPAFLARGVSALRALNSTLVLASQFTNYALANGAYRAFTEDGYDATIPAAAEGVISVAVLGQNGSLLSTSAKQAMQVAMNSQAQANLLVRVVDPSITTVPVTVTVMATAGSNPTTVQSAVTAALENYLSANTWNWSGTVRVDKLQQVIDSAAGVDYIVSLAAPTGNVTLSGFAPLAVAGTITVTVQTP